jgi:hypothetical protein
MQQPARDRVSLTAAPSSPRPSIDRQHRPWIPLYREYLRRHEDASGQLGHGLDPGPTILYALIVHEQGTPLDGRLLSKAERDGNGRFVPRFLSAGTLVREFGWSYDQVQSWGEDLCRPHPCGYCRRAHPLIAIDRPRGQRNRYRLIRCADVPESACVPLAAAIRKRRPKTGGGRSAGDHQGSLDLERTEPSENLRGFDGSGPPPSTAVEKRVLALAAIALLEEVTAAPDVCVTIATNVETNDVALLRDVLLRVIAVASIRRLPVTPELVNTSAAEAVEQPSGIVRHLGPVHVDAAAPSDVTAWSFERILELARRREPQTSLGQASAYQTELLGHITRRLGNDSQVVERELQRILTDPRIVGTMASPQMNPIALLRDALKHDWIWTAAERDDGSTRYARAFLKLPPGAQNEVRNIFERHKTGEPLPARKLAELGITSRGMIAWLTSTQ